MQAVTLIKLAGTLPRKIIIVAAMEKNTSMNTKKNTCTCSTAHKHPVTTNLQKKKNISRYIDFVKMLMPAVVFTIIPKCPICLAGYVALSTGIGLSVTTATYVRIILIILCILSLSYFVIKHIKRFIH